jgi:hypothetical protein
VLDPERVLIDRRHHVVLRGGRPDRNPWGGVARDLEIGIIHHGARQADAI